MSTSRLDVLRGMVAADPGNAFVRYGLAMEYRRAGEREEALREFRALRAANPDYVAAYQQGGQTCEEMGRLDDAREFYVAGIEAAVRKGDQHARSELQAALDLLG